MEMICAEHQRRDCTECFTEQQREFFRRHQAMHDELAFTHDWQKFREIFEELPSMEDIMVLGQGPRTKWNNSCDEFIYGSLKGGENSIITLERWYKLPSPQ